MAWLVRLVLFTLLIALLFRAAARLVRGILEGASGAEGRQARVTPGTKMVKDPVCGTYVVPSRALSASRGGETAFFCSSECQHAWQRR